MAHSAEGRGPCAPLAGAGVAVVARLLIGPNDVVAAGFDALGGEEGVDLVAPRVVVGPLADSVEHVFLDLDVLVTNGWVVKRAEDVVDDFVDGNTGIFPGVEDAAN